ncbi:hypothetical protein MLD38_028647 [Melastoma candidum]|uniref:Uncharacterized protein n=1 Tax=Melastoma candidum TaxID=119954 RepID=A0ACB9N7G6_9MYRT|nr:hypothetical protein MLD38_028647 [Melastoma candidum]
MKCPYCSSGTGRSTTTASGRPVTECSYCGRIISEYHQLLLPFHNHHHLFHLRTQITPLPLVTPDLPPIPSLAKSSPSDDPDADPFEPTGFVSAYSVLSLEPSPPLSFISSLSFSGLLADLERTLDVTSPSSTSSSSSSNGVVVDNIRAYMQIMDVASILGLSGEGDVTDHAMRLFRDCCSATCLRNRSVEALATAALVHAIREAQEPRTLQEISIAANVPQKEIGKYIKILGEALQLSQPINSNSISVHMPRFCTLLQLNKSAQELATHIGEVVINKCFCTRRNPISISAAAIYLACQLEDKRKTQAEICKVTGLTEVTLRKVYKELLENWDDLLPSNYTPAVPPEKAFPSSIPTSRASSAKAEPAEVIVLDKDNIVEIKPAKSTKDKSVEAKLSRFRVVTDLNQIVRVKDDADTGSSQTQVVSENQVILGPGHKHAVNRLPVESNNDGRKEEYDKDARSDYQHSIERDDKDTKVGLGTLNLNEVSNSPTSC